MGIPHKTKNFAALAGLVVAALTILVTLLWVDLPLAVEIGIALLLGLVAYMAAYRISGKKAPQTTNAPTVQEVFSVTGTPKYTYQKRHKQETDVSNYRNGGKGLLSVFGPTKAGKSVLVKKLIPDGLHLRGDVDSADALWNKAITELSAFTGRSQGTKQSTTATAGVGANIGVKRGEATGGLSGRYDHAAMSGSETGKSADDDPFLVIQDNLLQSNRVLVIDDFHFMPRSEQARVMAALKGLIDNGGRAVVITATHRAHLVGSLVPNMSGRFKYVEVDRWSHSDLKRIALAGFAELHLTDPLNLADELATNSFGSPQLMQRLCLQLVTENGYSHRQSQSTEVKAPEGTWNDFYTRGLNRMDAEVRWLQKLKRGPQERKPRIQYETADHDMLDGYGLIRVALGKLLPTMDLSKEQIHREVSSLVGQHPSAPRASETASKLRYLNDIAREPLDKKAKSDEEYRKPTEEDELDVDPVLEYEESGPTSTLRIVDPLYAFALRWWQKD